MIKPIIEVEAIEQWLDAKRKIRDWYQYRSSQYEYYDNMINFVEQMLADLEPFNTMEDGDE